jgi:hypothetical protein
MKSERSRNHWVKTEKGISDTFKKSVCENFVNALKYDSKCVNTVYVKRNKRHTEISGLL